MSKSDEILAEVREVKTRQADLIDKLYGQGGDPGDIPTIRSHLEELNGTVRNHRVKITVNRVLISVALLGGGGGGAWVTKLLEIW